MHPANVCDSCLRGDSVPLGSSLTKSPPPPPKKKCFPWCDSHCHNRVWQNPPPPPKKNVFLGVILIAITGSGVYCFLPLYHNIFISMLRSCSHIHNLSSSSPNILEGRDVVKSEEDRLCRLRPGKSNAIVTWFLQTVALLHTCRHDKAGSRRRRPDWHIPMLRVETACDWRQVQWAIWLQSKQENIETFKVCWCWGKTWNKKYGPARSKRIKKINM